MTYYQSQIILQTHNYLTSDNRSILKDLSLSFGRQKTGIVGRNGVGKSTLLKLIVGELKPYSGSVCLSGTIAYFPQNFTSYLDENVAEILGVAEKIAALDRIEKGSVEIKDFELLGDDWNIRSRISDQLKLFELNHIDLSERVNSISFNSNNFK